MMQKNRLQRKSQFMICREEKLRINKRLIFMKEMKREEKISIQVKFMK